MNQAPASELAGTLTEHPVTVLLIDDQKMVGETVRRMLADQPDIRLFFLDDPTRALELASDIRPTVILQDLVMPQLDGLALVAEFRRQESTRDIPMIVLSAREEPKTKAEAFARGANDYLVKLPDKLELLARIRYHSRGYISLLERNEALRKLELRNRFIRETFGRYLSDEVVTNLLDAPEGLRLGGEKREVTILMSDLRGFTAVSQALDAEQTVAMLNHYLEAMTDIIVRHGGTIDEFLGDGMLVFFGAPQRQDDDALRAVACALEMQLAMRDINAWNQARGLPSLEMGIGLNTGPVIVGNIGSRKRAKYGAVGSHVNLTGRVEACTVGGQVLISESTRSAIPTPLDIAGEMRVDPKGVKAPITLYDVVGIGAPYHLRLAQPDAALVTLAEPLPAWFVPLDGKNASEQESTGSLVRLSAREAELLSGRRLEPMTDLRLRLARHPGEDLYAKVLARPAASAGTVVLRFTSVPLPLVSLFDTLTA